MCEASVKLKILRFAVASVSKGFSYADYYYTIKIQYIFHLCGLSGHADYFLCFHPDTKCLWIVQILQIDWDNFKQRVIIEVKQLLNLTATAATNKWEVCFQSIVSRALNILFLV